jgi:haloalkane dehalogenase
MFRALRGPEGENIVLQDNFFVEKMLFEFGIIRSLSEKEKACYRAPFAEPGASRLPTLQRVPTGVNRDSQGAPAE